MRQSDGRRRATARKARYSSLSGFYNDDARRMQLAERDVGLWWREDADGPLHRAAWVSETGELYLVRLGAPEQGGGAVEVLATSPTASGSKRTARLARALRRAALAGLAAARAARLDDARGLRASRTEPARERRRRRRRDARGDELADVRAARESRPDARSSAPRPRRPQAGRVAASSSSA